jgi:ribosomal protein L16/L10AE
MKMGKRPSKSFREFKMANTRKEYVHRFMGLPEGLKKSVFGNHKEQFPALIRLVPSKDVQVSARAIVSVRVSINRELRILGEDKFRLWMKAYPHHQARSHGLVGVAKAERIASGMGGGSYGFPEMRLAQIEKGHSLLEIAINDDPISFGIALKGLHIVVCKLPPSGWKTIIEGISESTKSAKVLLPKRVKEKKGTGGQQIGDLQRELT